MDINWEDDLKLKLGRFNEHEGREIERLLRRRRSSPYGSRPLTADRSPRPRGDRYQGHGYTDKALIGRALGIVDSRQFGEGTEAVFKSVSRSKSRRGPRSLVRYISRTRRKDISRGRKPVPLFDEFGMAVGSVEPGEVTSCLDKWGLLSDKNNLSKQARDLRKREGAGRAGALRERERLHYVQTWHLVFSIKSEGELEKEIDALRRAVAVTVDQIFGAEGFRAIWCVHKDEPAHPHAHVMVSAVSRFGKRLRFDRYGDFLHSIRTEFASNLCSAGLQYRATWREDRKNLRQEILAGTEPLRTGLPISAYKRNRASLKHREPRWFRNYGGEMETGQRLSGNQSDLRQKKPMGQRKEVPEEFLGLYDALSKHFQDPYRATFLWYNLASEGSYQDEKGDNKFPSRALADWYLLKRPLTYGRIRSDTKEPSEDPVVLEALKRVSFLPRLRRPPDSDRNRTVVPSDPPVRRLQGRSDPVKTVRNLLRVADLCETRFQATSLADNIRRIVKSDVDYVRCLSPLSDEKKRKAKWPFGRKPPDRDPYVSGLPKGFVPAPDPNRQRPAQEKKGKPLRARKDTGWER